MTHIMLDLETWGTRPGCAVRSIGALEFDPATGETGLEFHRYIDDGACESVGLTRDPRTEAWWADQDEAARVQFNQAAMPLYEVVKTFDHWFCRVAAEYVWAHGASFDPPIWEAACVAVGKAAPWLFWNLRDTRTLFALSGTDLRSIPRDGIHHDALDDCRHQAQAVALAYRRLKGD